MDSCISLYVCVCVCVCARARARVRVCAHTYIYITFLFSRCLSWGTHREFHVPDGGPLQILI